MRDSSPIQTTPLFRPRAGADDASRAASPWPVLSAALTAVLLEACRYACGSPRSRLHQRAALRDLDDRRLADLGLTRREARSGRRSGDGGS